MGDETPNSKDAAVIPGFDVAALREAVESIRERQVRLAGDVFDGPDHPGEVEWVDVSDFAITVENDLQTDDDPADADVREASVVSAEELEDGVTPADARGMDDAARVKPSGLPSWCAYITHPNMALPVLADGDDEDIERVTLMESNGTDHNFRGDAVTFNADEKVILVDKAQFRQRTGHWHPSRTSWDGMVVSDADAENVAFWPRVSARLSGSWFAFDLHA